MTPAKLVTFFGNKVGTDLVVIRKDTMPSSTTPERELGAGYFTIEAPDSERARSLLSMFRSRMKAASA